MLLVMKARCPLDLTEYYFVDKCLPFGHTRSCALFQAVSDAISFLVKIRNKKRNINYLDDFFFVALNKFLCDFQVNNFLDICQEISFPVSLAKTIFAATRIVFLGLLIDTVLQLVCVPADKVIRIQNLLQMILDRKSRKMKLRELQQLCGYLNFLCKSVVPGRAFTRRLYYKTKKATKPNHHIYITKDMKFDMLMWAQFLQHETAFARPFMDFSSVILAEEIDMFSDASKNSRLGAGGVCQGSWFAVQWDRSFMDQHDPSIAYLELFAVTVAIKLWIMRFRNRRIILFCDNMSVVYMINKNSSNCRHCMKLIRVIVLESMIHNVRVFARHVKGFLNTESDLLSRRKFFRFRQITQGRYDSESAQVPAELWPLDKVW